MIDLTDDAQLRTQLSMKAKERTKLFKGVTSADKYASLYGSIIKK